LARYVLGWYIGRKLAGIEKIVTSGINFPIARVSQTHVHPWQRQSWRLLAIPQDVAGRYIEISRS
jgi:hypothetical protein